MKNIATSLLLLVSLIAPVFASQTVLAKDLFTSGTSGVDCTGEAKDSAVCAEHAINDNPLAGPDGLLIKIANIVALIAGAFAVVIIIISGLRYITSGGDSSNITSAKNTLINALIGIAVIALARTLIVFVISKI